MIDKRYYFGIGFVIIILVLIVPNYFNGNVVASGSQIYGDVEMVEIIHFHATSQCTTCIAVGDLAEETVGVYFFDEVESGMISFEHLNADLPGNLEKVKKYGVTGASLWIGVYYSDGSFVKEENINVWYKTGDRVDYMNYLKGVLEGKLSGN